MEILGIGPLEAVFVLILALLVVGPRDLGKAARSFGRFLNRLYRSEAWAAITQASQGLGRELDRLGRELKGKPGSEVGAPPPAPQPGGVQPGAGGEEPG